jgi:hypothetical protein
MTRNEQRKIKQAIRAVTVAVVEAAMRDGRYHDALEQAIGPLKVGSDRALVAAQECSEELVQHINRASA